MAHGLSLFPPVDNLVAEVMLAKRCDNFAVSLKGFIEVGDKTATPKLLAREAKAENEFKCFEE
jgi:hypothetical protein